MNMLDVRTLSLVALASSILLPLVLLAGGQFAGSRNPATQTLNRGIRLYASGFLCIALRSISPDWVGIVLANVLIFAGYSELVQGFRMYFGRVVRRHLEYAGLAVMLVQMVVYTYIDPSAATRAFYSALLMGTMSLAMAYEFFLASRDLPRNDPASRTERRLIDTLCLAFLLTGCAFMVRAYHFFGVHGDLDPNTVVGTAFGVSYLIAILLNFVMAASLPLLISRRNQQELFESRELLAETEDLALVGSLVYDVASEKSVANRVLADMLGAPDASQINLQSWLAQIDPTQRVQIGEKIQRMLGGEHTRIQAECRMLSLPGDRQSCVSLRCGLRRNAAGQVQFIASMRDITDIKAAAQAALAARDEADQANAAKSDFLANMSHEIRTPMNGVLGLTRLCLEGDLPPRERELIDKCHSQAQSLLGIVNDILDFSKIEAGKLSIESVPFHLDTVLDNARDLFEESAGGKGLRFVVDVASDVPRGLVGDALRLTQVLNNFLGNAVKFTEQGEVKLHIRRAPNAAPAGPVRLQFAVSDTGIGMTAQQQARLFQPFSQADSSTTRRYGGSGLGLVICNRIIGLMGGTLDLQSQEGVGSTFTASLPFGIAAQALVPKRTPPSRSEKLLRGMRILLVEDNPTNVLVATLSLENQGAQVHHLENGQLAVDYLREHAPQTDLVLMDIQMPVMDGYTATRLIRNELQLPYLPVVAMTANVLDTDRQASVLAGMNAHIGKPFDVAQLVQVIVQLVRGAPQAEATVSRSYLDSPASKRLTGTNATPTQPPLLDLAPALQRMGGNETLLVQAAYSFEKNLDTMLERLRSSVAAQDKTIPAQVLHTVKGLAATLGLTQLSLAATTLERDLKAGSAPQEDDLGALEQIALESLRALRQALAPLAGATQAPQPDPATLAAPSDQAHQVLADLRALLQESNMSALDFFAQHRSTISALSSDRFAALEEAMQNLDFDAALRTSDGL